MQIDCYRISKIEHFYQIGFVIEIGHSRYIIKVYLSTLILKKPGLGLIAKSTYFLSSSNAELLGEGCLRNND